MYRILFLFLIIGQVASSAHAADDPVQKAMKAYEKHRYEDAARELRAALPSLEQSKQSPARLTLGMIYLKIGKLASRSARSARPWPKMINPGCEYLLVLRKSDVARVLLKEQRALYDTSPVHDDFLVEDPQLHLPSSPPPLTATVQALNARLKDDPRVLSGTAQRSDFLLAGFLR